MSAALTIVLWGVGVQGDLSELRRETATLAAVVQADAKLIAELTSVEQGLAASEVLRLELATDEFGAERDAIVAVTLDPAAWTGVFEETTASHGASGEYRWSNTVAAGVIVVRRLPTLPLQSVYELWLDDGVQLMSGGTFVPNARGDGTVLVQPRGVIQPLRISIAVAPAGGSPVIGSPVVLSGIFDR